MAKTAQQILYEKRIREEEERRKKEEEERKKQATRITVSTAGKSAQQILYEQRIANAEAAKLSQQSQAASTAVADRPKDNGGFLGGLGYIGQSFLNGAVRGIEGIVDYTAGGLASIFGGDAGKEWAEELMTEDWYNYNAAAEKFNPSGGWQLAGDVVGGVGQSTFAIGVGLLTSIATGGAAAPAAFAGLGTTFLSSAGTAVSDAVKDSEADKQGLDYTDWLYGTGAGALEAGIEAATGGVGKVTNKLFGKTLGEMGSEIAEAITKKAVKNTVTSSFGKELLKEMAGEGLEEGLSAFFEPYIKQATYDKDAENASLGDIAYSALVGALAGGATSGAVSLTTSSINNVDTLKRGSDIAKDSKKTADLLKNAEVISGYESKRETGSEVYEAVMQQYEKVKNSLASTGGTAQTNEQKKMLGELDRYVSAAVLQPSIVNAAKGVALNADSYAESLNAFYQKTNAGRTVTAADLTAGLKMDGTSKEFVNSVNRAMRSNTVLREVVVNNTLGRMEMDAQAYADSIYGDTRISAIATQENINRFVESEDADTVKSVERALGVDMRTATPELVAAAVKQFRDSGNAAAYEEGYRDVLEAKKVQNAERRAQSAVFEGSGDVEADTRTGYSDIETLERMLEGSEGGTQSAAVDLTDADGTSGRRPLQEGATRFASGESDIAVIKHGDRYRIYDYKTGKITRSLTVSELRDIVGRMRGGKRPAIEVIGRVLEGGVIPTNKSHLNSTEKNGIIKNSEQENGNEGKRELRLREGSKRDDGKNTQRQVSRVEGGTRQAEGGRKASRIADSEAARLVDEGTEVTPALLGIEGGSKKQTVKTVDRKNETASMRKARRLAEERGLKVRFFVGGNLRIKAKSGDWINARAYIDGDQVYVRADHPLYTADQLVRHEIGHDMIAKGEVDIKAVRERLLETVGKENIDAVAEAYAEAYAGTGMTADEIFEECICDALGDMNVFAESDTEGSFFDEMLSKIKAASDSKAAKKTRGAPDGKASRNIQKAKYISYNRIGIDNVSYITEQLKKLYGDMESGIADEIAIARGDTVYIVDSGIENGKIKMGIREKLNFSDSMLRDEYVRRNNNDAVSKGRVSDGLSSKLKREDDSSRARNLRRESGSELQADKGKSKDQQSGVLGEDADNRGLSKASREFTSAEEAKASGKVSDAKFSIEFADDIATKQRKFVADGLSRISSEELEQAIADTAHMVNEMKPYANILPQDKVGKTLVKNGSYDVSVENTTVCIRTLAYNSFVDMVSEKVGRPLTQMESFLVSQKLYEIAKEPQCLYCYVSLDRKAFNEMVIRYTEQRDAAIKAYEEAGKPKIPKAFDAEWSLFKEFLDGRKATTNMWDRYVGWLNSYNKGERLVSLSDISTEAKRLELVEEGGEIASQVKDILKYAQSASWAKKQTQYVAYYDEILKLKPAVIRNLNNHYGMRWYSFSDYSGAFIVENMQQITDAAIRGLKGLSYTKDTDFAEIFAPTGMNINISVYAKNTDGGYEIDAKQSANIEEAIKLRKQYPNVGIVVVATDKAGVEWALAQEWSDVVIPFHTVRTGADVAEFYNWEKFNSEQSDTVTDQNLWDAYVNDVGKKKASKMVYPSEHQNNRETYLSICEKRGLTPRFKSFLDNPNYMKLVNETRQSEGETQPLKPNFNLDAAERSFDKFVEKGGYYEGWYNDGIDVDGEAEIVAEDVKVGKKANEVSYGRQDISFDDIAKSRKTNRQHGKASLELKSDKEQFFANGEEFSTPTIHTVGKERVTYKPDFKDWLFTKKTSAYIHSVDEMYGVQVYLEKVGKIKNAKYMIQSVRSSPHQAQSMIGSVQYNVFEADSRKAKKLGEGLNEILKPIEAQGEKVYEGFNDYLLHKLNVDKYEAFDKMKLTQESDLDNLRKVQSEIESLSEQKERFEEELFELGKSARDIARKNKLKEFIERNEELINQLRADEEKLLVNTAAYAEEELSRVNEDKAKTLREIRGLEKEIFELGNDSGEMSKKRELRDALSKKKKQVEAFDKQITKLTEIMSVYSYALKPVFYVEGYVPTREQSEQYVSNYERNHPEFLEIAKKLWSFNDNLNRMRVSAGLISESVRRRMSTMYPHYVPAFRAKVEGGAKGDKGVQVSSTVKKAKGYNHGIMDIKESISAQVSQVVRNGNVNALANKVYDTAVKTGDAKYVDIGIPDPEGANISPEGADRPKPHIITFYRNGVEYQMSVSDEIYLGFKGIGEASASPSNVFARAFNWINDKFKKLVTQWSPAFTIRNSVRDLQDAGINSKHPLLFGKNLPFAWYKILQNSDEWQIYRAYGGFSSTVFDSKGTKGNVGKRGFEAIGLAARLAKKEKLSIKDVKYLAGLAKGVSNLNAVVEQVPRFAEFLASLEAGETIEQAVYNSAEVTTNFARRGATTKAFNSTIVPFLNPAIQGFDKIFRNFGDAFEEKNAKAIFKGLVTLFTKALALGILPMLLNSLMYEDDEDYKDLREEDKENNYLFKLPNGTFLKLPRGRVASVIAGLANRTKQSIKGEDPDWLGYAGNVVSQITPVSNLTRTIFSPFMDVWRNVTWYGTAIEGPEFDNVRPKDRYDENTSSIAIALGKLLNYSPKKIHYLIDQYSGVIGDFILPLTTQKEEKDFFSGNFALDSVTSNKIPDKFYSLYDEAQYAKTDGDLTAQYQVRFLNRVKNAVGELYAEISAIQQSELPGVEKLKQVRLLRILINETMKNAINDYDKITDAIKETANLGYDDTNQSQASERYAEIIKRVYGAERALKEYNSTVYEKLSLYASAGIDYENLYTYYFTTKGLTSDKDEDGKTISGSLKKKVIDAIWQLDISNEQKLLLIASKYKLSDDDIPGVSGYSAQMALYSYIESLEGLTDEERLDLFEACGFEVKDGAAQMPTYGSSSGGGSKKVTKIGHVVGGGTMKGTMIGSMMGKDYSKKIVKLGKIVN